MKWIAQSKTCFIRPALLGPLFLSAVIMPFSGKSAPSAQAKDVLLSTMQDELQRAQTDLGKLDPAPYFISYSVYDQDVSVAVAMQGSLVNSTRAQRRLADVILRLGSRSLDNAHGENRPQAINSGAPPLVDDPDATARSLWQLTYRQYRKAANAYLNVKTKTQVQAKEEDTSADFSEEKPQHHLDYQELAPIPDQHALEQMVRGYSAILAQFPYVYSSAALVMAERSRLHFLSSEGSQVVSPRATIRIAIQAESRADDGMELIRVETFEAEDLNHIPPEAEIAARVRKMALDLKDLRTAPVAEPFEGPALLSGRAAAVFFHEVLGHRLEGQRQRGEDEGQTFTKKINQAVLPAFLSVTDDPTQRTLSGLQLAGWYDYDDEGIPASRVPVIENGILKNFLMSRMPIKNFAQSNGHGRAQAGLMPTGRQGNLLVTSSRVIKDSELRQKLIEEIKKQGKPYGLYFEDIEGGFTLTQRAMPQAFQVLPVMVWRVYADGRPDELVRGVSIVGTPLAALSHIVVTGETTSVFNGICGAESGSVPVSAAAPAMLFSDIEVQKQSHSLNRPPILAPPRFDTGNKAPANTGGQP
ncbi:MAG TPA: metallopeptidase TldD-related protein [Terriglobales bacterium]